MKFAPFLFAFVALAASEPNVDFHPLRNSAKEDMQLVPTENSEVGDRQLQAMPYYHCFKQIRCDDSVNNGVLCSPPLDYPNVQNFNDINPGSVSLPFGPYHSTCKERDSFHSGISLRGNIGDTVQSIRDGTVVYVGASFIEVEYHFFQYGPCLNFFGDGRPVVSWYARYVHMDPDPSLVVGTPVVAGQPLGSLRSHTCTKPNGEHIVSTSLEFQVFVDDMHVPGNYDYTGLGFDPRLNPFLALGYLDYPIDLEADDNIGGTEDDWVVTAWIEQDEPIMNFFTVVCSDNGVVEDKTFFIDLNKRQGVPEDPTNIDKTVPYIEPTSSHTFTIDGTHFRVTQLVVPYGWLADMYECEVTICNIWKTQCANAHVELEEEDE